MPGLVASYLGIIVFMGLYFELALWPVLWCVCPLWSSLWFGLQLCVPVIISLLW